MSLNTGSDLDAIIALQPFSLVGTGIPISSRDSFFRISSRMIKNLNSFNALSNVPALLPVALFRSICNFSAIFFCKLSIDD
ncbi:hypothetical protein RchiOBHm_Chr5g0006681 [Rosa chinensis]|uniref:Uncharacterized protein n=1 Tax=Rosa chinensis TaxID=74649 RepID=A0A2P6Q3L5_ROSCH|nr:hypothetical protein RchiOBHm_Chr5g0006681 [Rosa chinensis]